MTTENKSPRPSPLYKRPIRYKGRDYFFYSYTKASQFIYAANRKNGEKYNSCIITDEKGNILSKATLLDYRKELG